MTNNVNKHIVPALLAGIAFYGVIRLFDGGGTEISEDYITVIESEAKMRELETRYDSLLSVADSQLAFMNARLEASNEAVAEARREQREAERGYDSLTVVALNQAEGDTVMQNTIRMMQAQHEATVVSLETQVSELEGQVAVLFEREATLMELLDTRDQQLEQALAAKAAVEGILSTERKARGRERLLSTALAVGGIGCALLCG